MHETIPAKPKSTTNITASSNFTLDEEPLQFLGLADYANLAKFCQLLGEGKLMIVYVLAVLFQARHHRWDVSRLARLNDGACAGMGYDHSGLSERSCKFVRAHELYGYALGTFERCMPVLDYYWLREQVRDLLDAIEQPAKRLVGVANGYECSHETLG